MRTRPILFNSTMVRAILDGRKTQTRRIVKPQPPATTYVQYTDGIGCGWAFWEDGDYHWIKAPYSTGDILYVRETWGDYRECSLSGEDGFYYLYRADYPDGARCVPLSESERTDYADSYDLPRWHPSIHMPKEAARLFLRVTDVRVERLKEIQPEDIWREGVGFGFQGFFELYEDFERLWNSTVKKADINRYGWVANPWVWVIEFERCEEPKEE